MKLLAIDVDKVTTKSYTIQKDDQTFCYVDYFNEDGKVIDSRLETVDGYAVEIPALFEEIQEFVDTEADPE
jgi:hypothetical protein